MRTQEIYSTYLACSLFYIFELLCLFSTENDLNDVTDKTQLVGVLELILNTTVKAKI